MRFSIWPFVRSISVAPRQRLGGLFLQAQGRLDRAEQIQGPSSRWVRAHRPARLRQRLPRMRPGANRTRACEDQRLAAVGIDRERPFEETERRPCRPSSRAISAASVKSRGSSCRSRKHAVHERFGVLRTMNRTSASTSPSRDSGCLGWRSRACRKASIACS